LKGAVHISLFCKNTDLVVATRVSFDWHLHA